MTDYRTLLVAPKPDFTLLGLQPKDELKHVDDEVQQVNNLLGAKLLQGQQANITGLLAMLVNPFDIVWFATHGDEKGVYLTDGIIDTSEITSIVRSCGAQLVVFNTCSSKNVARDTYDELHIPMVCTLKPVPDRMAFITGTLFARKVADGYGFREAYELAKPGQNSTYLFLPEKETVTEMPPLDTRISKPEQDLSSILNAVRRLEILVTGDPGYNVEGLLSAVKRLTESVDQLNSDLSVVKQNQHFNRTLLSWTITLCLLLLLSLAVIALRGYFS